MDPTPTRDTPDPHPPAGIRPVTAPAALAARCADLVAERYVDPAVGERCAGRVRGRAAAGEYDDLVPALLATALTEDLQDVAHDLHLRVIHHPGGVPPTQEAAAVDAHWHEQARSTAGGVRRVERLDGNVAHVVLGPVLTPAGPSWEAVTAAMALVADADALVLDVRGCLGGDPATVQLVMSHVVGDEPERLVDIESRDDGLRQRWTHPVAARRFGPDRPLVVLTSGATFSGGEELAFDVRMLGRGRVVGERTRGGANPREGVVLDATLELAVSVARARDPHDGSSWEGVGVTPDVACQADEALDRALALLRDELSG